MSENDPLYFMDTNVLVYAFDTSTGEKHKIAMELVEKLQSKRSVCISIQVMQEFHVTVTQKIQRPISIEQSQAILLGLSKWSVHSPKRNDVISAIVLQQQYRFSFWDALIIRSAAACKCTVLYSEDLKHGQVIDDLKIVNPFFPSN